MERKSSKECSVFLPCHRPSRDSNLHAVNLLSFSLYWDYSYSLTLSNVGEQNLELNSEGPYPDSKENKIWPCLFTVQHKKKQNKAFFLRRSRVKTERNEQKIVKYVQSCCFANFSCKTRESDVTWTRMPDGCSPWFLFLRSAVSNLEKPLLAG